MDLGQLTRREESMGEKGVMYMMISSKIISNGLGLCSAYIAIYDANQVVMKG